MDFDGKSTSYSHHPIRLSMFDCILGEFNGPIAGHYSWRLNVGDFIIKTLYGRLYYK